MKLICSRPIPFLFIFGLITFPSLSSFACEDEYIQTYAKFIPSEYKFLQNLSGHGGVGKAYKGASNALIVSCQIVPSSLAAAYAAEVKSGRYSEHEFDFSGYSLGSSQNDKNAFSWVVNTGIDVGEPGGLMLQFTFVGPKETMNWSSFKKLRTELYSKILSERNLDFEKIQKGASGLKLSKIYPQQVEFNAYEDEKFIVRCEANSGSDVMNAEYSRLKRVLIKGTQIALNKEKNEIIAKANDGRGSYYSVHFLKGTRFCAVMANFEAPQIDKSKRAKLLEEAVNKVKLGL